MQVTSRIRPVQRRCAALVAVALALTASPVGAADSTDISANQRAEKKDFTDPQILDGFFKTAFGAEYHLAGRVDRIAPIAVPGELQSTLTAYCRLEVAVPELRPGMTGHARISTGRRSLGEIVAGRVLRVLRTEFWW